MSTKQRKVAGKPVFPTAEYDRYDVCEVSIVDGNDYNPAVTPDAGNRLFETIEEYHKLVIRTSATITVKLNGSSKAITIAGTDSPFETPDGMKIRSVRISNSGTAAVKMLGV